MFSRRFTRVLLASAALTLTATAATQAAILSVDFDSGSPTETDFVSQPDNNRTFGAYTVTSSTGNGDGSFFDRPSLGNSGAFTYAELYRDFNYVATANGTIDYTVSGLAASTAYAVRVYAYDHGETGTHTVNFGPTSGSGTTGTSGAVTYVAGTAPTTNHQYSTLLTLTTDAGGVLSFTATGPNAINSLRVNGFEVSAVPEPASLALMGLGAVLVCRRRRRC